MEDSKIISLFMERSENAICESQNKYGKYCSVIAGRILRSPEDCEECVSDTWVSAWNSIPPAFPNDLKIYLGTLTRNIALDRYDYNKADKRKANTDLVIDEYSEIISDPESLVENELIFKDLINTFLAQLRRIDRIVFLQRYYYFCSLKEISEKNGINESNVKVILHRTRNRLRDYLKKEGITV